MPSFLQHVLAWGALTVVLICLNQAGVVLFGFNTLVWIVDLPSLSAALIPGETLFEKVVVCELGALVVLKLFGFVAKPKINVSIKKQR
jgi:hypothetical protein